MDSSAAPGYQTEVIVRFSMCDPAGIVFYPRYFEIFNTLVEDWVRELGIPLDYLMKTDRGLPLVHTEVDFLAPSFLGETLSASLWPREVGEKSVTVDIGLAGGDGKPRVKAKLVLVLADRNVNRGVAWPPEVRRHILAQGAKEKS